MRKESLNSKRIKVINTHSYDLAQNVIDLSESLVDGDFELSMENITEMEGKLKLIKGLVQEGHILKPKRK